MPALSGSWPNSSASFAWRPRPGDAATMRVLSLPADKLSRFSSHNPNLPCSRVESVASNNSDSNHNHNKNSRPTKRRFSIRSTCCTSRLLPRFELAGLEAFPGTFCRLAQTLARREGVRCFGRQREPERLFEQLEHAGGWARGLAEE